YQSAPVCFPDSASQNLALVRDGDTIRLSISGGNTVAFRDSTRSNQDITTVIRDSIPTVDSVWHKGDSIVVRMTDGHRWAVLDKIGGELDTVYFDSGELCIQYTDLAGPTLICTPVDIPGDDWGDQVAQTIGQTLTGTGITGNELRSVMWKSVGASSTQGILIRTDITPASVTRFSLTIMGYSHTKNEAVSV